MQQERRALLERQVRKALLGAQDLFRLAGPNWCYGCIRLSPGPAGSQGPARPNWRFRICRSREGPSGPTGPTGATGPAGISKAFSNNGSQTTLPPGSVRNLLQVASVTVPTGTYVVNFSVYGEDMTPTAEGFNTSLQCQEFSRTARTGWILLIARSPIGMRSTADPSNIGDRYICSEHVNHVSCGTGPLIPGTGTATVQGRIQAVQVTSLTTPANQLWMRTTGVAVSGP